MARRRAWVVLLTTLLVVAAAYLVAGLRPVTYTADSVLVVPSGAGGNGPGQANEALTLAATYAELLPRDRRLLAAIAETTGQDVSTVAGRLTASPVGDTALLRLSYTDPDGATAVAASVTAAQTVLTALDTVAPRSLRLVSLATPETVQISGGTTRSTGPVSALLGLALGLVLATAAERADRRVDRPRQLADLVGAPAAALDGADRGDLAGLGRALRSSPVGSPVGSPGGAVLPVLPVATSVATAERACEDLVAELPGLHLGPGDPPAGALTLLPATPEAVAGEREPGPVVLVVPRGARWRTVREEVADLAVLGFAPVTAALLVRSR